MKQVTLFLLTAMVVCIVASSCSSPSGNSTSPNNDTAAASSPTPASATPTRNQEEYEKAKRLSESLKKRGKATADRGGPEARAAEKCYSWVEPWIDGDCQLAGPSNPAGLTGPIVCFRPDGTGTFRSRGRSTDDDDTYVVRFDVLGSGGNVLFRVPTREIFPGIPSWWSRDLPNPGNWYDFNEDFTYPASHYPNIDNVEAWSGC